MKPRTTLAVAVVVVFTLCGSCLARSPQTQPDHGKTANASALPQSTPAKTAGATDQEALRALEQLRSQLDVMQRKVNLLRSEALSVQDPNTRDALFTEADLWQQLITALSERPNEKGKSASPHK